MTANQVSSALRTVDATTVSSSTNVRFALRKKRNLSERNRSEGNTVHLSFNSDFLSGLFADVAKANVLKELSIEHPSSSTPSTETTCPPSMFDEITSSHVVPDSTDSPRPMKKSRVSFRSSSYRSRASCLNLFAQMSSPKGINEFSSIEKSKDSLSHQLNCLEQEKEEHVTPTRSVSPTNKAKKVSQDAVALAFPILPSTVSDSSCESNNVTATGLTRERCLIQHGSAPEITTSRKRCSKESFGWFVDLDDTQDSSPFTGPTKSEKTTSSQALAFQAPASPKEDTTNHVQEEVDQAYAADTIDSVLGDFF
jgi:hypothetical protein